jgi:hypothetical protein
MKPGRLPRAAAALITALALAGCAAVSPPAAAPTALSHIHGLAFDPGRDVLVAATHAGVFRLDIQETPAAVTGPIGGLDIDAMGFSLVGDVAYASGHPGPTTPDDFGSPNLGLIRTDDGGATWSNVSLAGTTDFHDISVSESLASRIYGLAGSALRRSDDGGESWTSVATIEARDILTPASDANTLFATTAEGLIVSRDAGATFSPVLDTPPLYLVTDTGTAHGGLVGIDTSGTIWTQSDADGSWSPGGQVSGTPQAMLVLRASGRLVVADDRGISASGDDGRTWELLWTS